MPDQLSSNDIVAWHPRPVQRIAQAIGGKRLGHAQLLCGVPGIGKRALSRWLAQLLLCEQRRLDVPPGFCGECKSCLLLSAGTHPDFIPLAPEEAGKTIGVEAVRAFGARLVLTAQLAGNRVGILDPADAMTINAANALLKSLEEPPAGTYLILVSDFPARLLPTVRSRCQRIELRPPANELALQWLAPQVDDGPPQRWLDVARGAPLRALEYAHQERRAFRDTLFENFAAVLGGGSDPVCAAGEYARGQLPVLLACLDSWISDLIRLTAAGPEVALSNSDLGEALCRHYGKLDLHALFGYLDKVRDAAASPVALNTQLVVEELFICASRLGSTAER
ncbi:MAG: DNA polymerase III subunit delta' [Gammaproteobacteria bacterium]|nr:DNA polymerase III subunit delta' [Gammaproteobacteria bacterium]